MKYSDEPKVSEKEKNKMQQWMYDKNTALKEGRKEQQKKEKEAEKSSSKE